MSISEFSFTDYKVRIRKWLETKDNLLVYFIFFGVAGFLITYTSNSELYLSWALEIKNFDFSGFNIVGNPIWFFYIITCTWIQFYLESFLPFVFGSNNIFLLRFLFKVPIFITFFICTNFLLKFIKKKGGVDLNKSFAIIFILIMLPLFYIAFVWGSPIIIGLFFFLLYVETKNKPEASNFYKGILIGFSISFSVSFLILFLPFILKNLRLKQKEELTDEISGLITIWILILLPYVIWNGKYLLNSGNTNIGFTIWLDIINDFSLINISIQVILCALIIIGALFLLGMIVLVKKFSLSIKKSFNKDLDLFLYSFLIFFPFLGIESSFILILIILVNLLMKLRIEQQINLDREITLKSYKHSLIVVTRTILFVTAISFLLLLLFYSLPINSVFHIDVIRVSSFAKYQQSLTDLDRKIISFFFYYSSIILLEIIDILFFFKK